MANTIELTPPLSLDDMRALHIGDSVLFTGEIYCARDAAHKKMVELIKQGKELPIALEGQVIYYMGPAPAKPGAPIGSAGPTTSSRMDPYAPVLIEHGLRGMIGKGERTAPVADAMKNHGAVYFAAIGGAGALISKSITKSEVVAYEELGAEAIRLLTVEKFPVIVAQDAHGGNLYREGMERYAR